MIHELAPRDLEQTKDKRQVMPTFNEKSFQAIKDWYTEWSRIPTYIATISFAAIAFSITNLWQKDTILLTPSIFLLKWSWVFLGLSAGLASSGIFFGYLAFDLGVRIHLKDTLQTLSIKSPTRTTKWIRALGICSGVCSLLAIVLLLIGCLFLMLFALRRAQY
jgi:hypothetical protein